MSETLYRKYRPQTFEEVVGQNHVKITLLNELVSGRIAHAYLFTGPRGVGKTTVARLLAKAVNCLHRKKDGNSDNTCEACKEITSGQSLDLIEIDAASHTGVENVRAQVIENARFTPSRWKYKVFIIDEVHMLSISAFNALLKTLEEPPEHALFILATTEVHKVPETIISRCQRFDFRKLRSEDLVERLRGIVGKEKIAVEDEVVEEIARTARGSARDAESLLGQVLTLGDGKSVTREQAELVLPRSDFDHVLELFDALVRKDATAGITVINTLIREGVHLGRFTQDALELFRKVLLLKVNSQLAMFSTLEFSKEQEEQVLAQVERVDLAYVERMITVFLAKEQQLKTSILPQLPLELAVVELTAGLESEPVFAKLPARPNRPAGTSASNAPEQTPSSDVPKPQRRTKSSGGDPLTLEAVQQRWVEILGYLQSRNQSLRLTMNVAVPQRVEEDAVVLGVGYEFHRERIEMPKNRALIEQAFVDIFHQAISVHVVLADVRPTVPSYETEANLEAVVPQSGSQPASVPATESTNTLSDATWNALIEAFGRK